MTTTSPQDANGAWEWADAGGAIHSTDDPSQVPPGGRIVTRAWFVGCLMEHENGRMVLLPLSTVLMSAALAEQVAATYRADGIHNATALPVTLTHDPADPRQLVELGDHLLNAKADRDAARLS